MAEIGNELTSRRLLDESAVREQSIYRIRKIVLGTVGYLVLGAGALFMILPLIWMISTSLKDPTNIFSVPIQWIPTEIHWANYPESLRSAPFARYFFNSFFVASTVTLSNLFFCSLAGFGFAKYNFPLKNVMFILILSTMMVPFQVIMLPLYLVVKTFGWLNSYAGLIIPGAMGAFGVFLMRQFITSIPNELFDAARIDGSSEFGSYWRIVLPLAKPALAALAIFTFMGNWDSLLWPLIVVNKVELRPLSLGLSEFVTEYSRNYNYLMAATTTSLIPIVGLFLFLQKNFIRGIVLSGLK